MKKLSLSFGLILAFAFYVLFSSSKTVPLILPASQTSETPNQQPQSQTAATPGQQPQVQTTPPSSIRLGDDFEGEDDGFRRRIPAQTGSAPSPSASVPSVSGTQTNVQAQPGGMMSGGMGTTMMGQYKNGSYTGNVADAYYGYVQVKAVISGGKISDVQFLQHPSDRSTSIEINNYAMPMLTQEAIQVQNSNVDIVSGATETSLAFRDSLASALAQAK